MTFTKTCFSFYVKAVGEGVYEIFIFSDPEWHFHVAGR